MVSILFEPTKLGSVPVKNRFVHSATYEGMATEASEVTDQLLARYQRLAEGDVGLIIPGGFHVHPLGRTARHQTGIHTDAMIASLKKLVKAALQKGSRMAFQLVHAGGQAKKEVIGQTPIQPKQKRGAKAPLAAF